MLNDIQRILIPRQQIAQRIDELARQIDADLAQRLATPPNPTAPASPGAPPDAPPDAIPDATQPPPDPSQPPPASPPPPAPDLTLIPILTGSFIFVADLIRRLPVYMRIELMSVTSYPGAATASRGAAIRDSLTALPQSLAGQHVLVVDDILDSGQTMKLVLDLLREKNPASLQSCVLLRKNLKDAQAAADRPDADYICFDIPDEFVVGYGLDYDGLYRNLPDIAILRPQVIGR